MRRRIIAAAIAATAVLGGIAYASTAQASSHAAHQVKPKIFYEA